MYVSIYVCVCTHTQTCSFKLCLLHWLQTRKYIARNMDTWACNRHPNTIHHPSLLDRLIHSYLNFAQLWYSNGFLSLFSFGGCKQINTKSFESPLPVPDTNQCTQKELIGFSSHPCWTIHLTIQCSLPAETSHLSHTPPPQSPCLDPLAAVCIHAHTRLGH